MKFRVYICILIFGLAGCAATENADTFTEQGMLHGSTMSREICAWPDTSVWVVVDGRGECIRYFHSGLQQNENDIAMVWLHGDRMRQNFDGGKSAHPSYRKETSDELKRFADGQFRQFGIPYIRLSRPGTYGSSGYHERRRTPKNVRIVFAAFDALKKKYGIKKFAISGQSGGGHLIGALLTNRNDVVCAVATSGALAVQQRIDHFGWSTDITGYSDFYDPIDHVNEIPQNKNRRIFIIADPRDTVVPFITQKNYYNELKKRDHNVWLIEGRGRGRNYHKLADTGSRVLFWCVEGMTTNRILDFEGSG